MTTHFAIAGVQMEVSAVQNNIPAMESRLNVLVRRFPWVQMVVFSELAPYGPLPGTAQESLLNDALETFSRIAAYHKIWLIPGSLFEKKADNLAPVFNPDGKRILDYRKMFPFRPYEDQVTAGREFGLFDVPNVGRFGLSICYDMWFPETTRTLASMGAEVILHPTMTDTIDRDVELSIVRASAVTNQCYFFDINGSGDGGVGRSIIVAPSGYVLHQAAGGNEIMPVEINLARVRRERRVGVLGLGQPLKSFRDRPVEFPVYQGSHTAQHYLQSLGPLHKPERSDLYTASEHNPTVDYATGTPSAFS